MTDAGMDGVSWVRVIFAFAAVFALIALMGLVLKHIKMRGFTLPGAASRNRRLEVVESLMLDPRRRLVIARCDGKEHLLLLGIGQDIVVAANLDNTPAGMQIKGSIS